MLCKRHAVIIDLALLYVEMSCVACRGASEGLAACWGPSEGIEEDEEEGGWTRGCRVSWRGSDLRDTLWRVIGLSSSVFRGIMDSLYQFVANGITRSCPDEQHCATLAVLNRKNSVFKVKTRKHFT